MLVDTATYGMQQKQSKTKQAAGVPVKNPRIVKVREAIKLVEEDGWYLDRTRGSHRQYKHASKRGLVTIAGKPGDELAPGTKNSILKQAGLK